MPTFGFVFAFAFAHNPFNFWVKGFYFRERVEPNCSLLTPLLRFGFILPG
jgi:hypothetical protein